MVSALAAECRRMWGLPPLLAGRPDVLALDRDTVRHKDQFGHLHLSETPICKAQIDDYLGSEIPGAAGFGLQPDRLYRMYRDPRELAAAIDTFNRIPILLRHEPTTSADHQQDLVIGATGSAARFRDGFVLNSCVFWPQDAIDLIESGQQKELSPAYAYDPVMGEIEVDGERADGRMTNIRANHLALVIKGRQGDEICVADADPFIRGASSMNKQRPSARLRALEQRIVADVKRLYPGISDHAILRTLDRSRLALDQSEQSPEERQRQKNAERAEALFVDLNDLGLANMPDEFKKKIEELFSLAKLGGADDAESEEDREGRHHPAPQSPARDTPSAFGGMPMPGGEQVPLANKQARDQRDRALAADARMAASGRAAESYFSRFKSAARIRTDGVRLTSINR